MPARTQGGPAYPETATRGGLTVRQRYIDSITGCAAADLSDYVSPQLWRAQEILQKALDGFKALGPLDSDLTGVFEAIIDQKADVDEWIDRAKRNVEDDAWLAYGDHVREGVGQRARPAGAVGARR